MWNNNVLNLQLNLNIGLCTVGPGYVKVLDYTDVLKKHSGDISSHFCIIINSSQLKNALGRVWKLWWIPAGLLKFQASLMLQALKMENDPSQKTWTWNFNIYLVWRLHFGRLLLVAEAVREHSICGKKIHSSGFSPELPHKCLFISATGTSLIVDEASWR